jgi:hypothetical protein
MAVLARLAWKAGCWRCYPRRDPGTCPKADTAFRRESHPNARLPRSRVYSASPQQARNSDFCTAWSPRRCSAAGSWYARGCERHPIEVKEDRTDLGMRPVTRRRNEGRAPRERWAAFAGNSANSPTRRRFYLHSRVVPFENDWSASRWQRITPPHLVSMPEMNIRRSPLKRAK